MGKRSKVLLAKNKKLKIRGGKRREVSDAVIDRVESGAYQKLTPTDSVEDEIMEGYEDALDFVFDESNADLHNVAIMGPYCSGKSSVLETYKKKHGGDRTFYQVNLARFSDPDEMKRKDKTDGCVGGEVDSIAPEPETKEEKQCVKKRDIEGSENTIEGRMLNQLIQQMPHRYIRYSNFRIKKDLCLADRIFISIGIAFVVIGIVFLSLCGEMQAWIETCNHNATCGEQHDFVYTLIEFTLKPWFRFAVIVIVCCILFCFLFRMMSVLINRRLFRKISLNGNEFELFSREDDSYFDKYLNEIIYLFYRQGGAVVVFEDLDRFNDTQIFVRLRDINRLINCRVKNPDKNPVRFFYLLRDDVFLAKDKTKFFDFIVPVVPMMDASNSKNVLARCFAESGLDMRGIDDEFLNGMCVYIDDIRLVKNIFNEFKIFEGLLKKTNRERDGFTRSKLLAMTAYKNVFPTDYANLQLNRGFVYTLLTNIGEDGLSEDDLKNMSGIEFDARVREAAVELEDSDPGSCSRIEGDRYFGLVKYLIMNGYIDGTYSVYMTYTYEGGLGVHDAEFVRAVQNREKTDWNYNLFNVDSVARYMTSDLLSRPEVLNFAFVDYLVDENDDKKNIKKLGAIARQLGNEATSGAFAEFFLSYYSHARGRGKEEATVTAFNRSCPEFFSNLCRMGNEFSDILYPYSICSLLGNTHDELARVDSHGVSEKSRLSAYISSQMNYLAGERLAAVKVYDKSMEDVLLDALKNLGVRFVALEEGAIGDDMLDNIYESGLYERNEENFRMFFKRTAKEAAKGKNRGKILTAMSREGDGGLYSCYMRDNPDLLLTLTLAMSKEESTLCDDESVVAAILSEHRISAENVDSYLDKNATVITNLAGITDAERYPLILNANKVEYSGKNILSFFDALGFTDDLVNFINSSDEPLTFDGDDAPIPLRYEFYRESTKSERLDAEKFKQIVSKFGIKIYVLDSGLPKSKVKILRDRGMIEKNEMNEEKIRSEYHDVPDL